MWDLPLSSIWATFRERRFAGLGRRNSTYLTGAFSSDKSIAARVEEAYDARV